MTSAAGRSALLDVRDRIATVVDHCEGVLTSGTFGVGSHISGTADAYYRGAGRICAQATGIDPEIVLPSLAPGTESLRRSHLDTGLRAAFAGDLAGCAAELESYADRRAEVHGGELRPADGPRLAEDWGVPGSSGGALERFTASTVLDGEPVALRHAEHDPALAEAVRSATSLATAAAPRIAGDAFSCVSRVGAFSTEATLCSGYASSAALFVFINQEALRVLESAAEFLLHESLHQKLNDISLARTLVRADYDDAQSDQVHVPWSFGSDKVRSFGADRSFAAFHVYTHQVLLYLGMYLHGLADEERAIERAALAWARADVFARAIDSGELDRELGHDGRRLSAWLGGVVDRLGEITLPAGRQLSSYRGAVHE
ncbi:hypothetical protein SRABI98_02370 [Microbacterium sp. Bi98]|uniref:hypothetical protein n=1 Tax=unclassified Microbacterium TaxID=2609290 RepID=UPI0006F476A8|nr:MULTISPECIES: hypothetical protein [unclassified Microbacterium]KRD53675.1 hypothetical protein ASE34_00765 [Microbacterium sp. Root280D1]CAH0216012.1 hypothetical protein SRABI98_02370 [Microbacterium sp. Bi98]